MTKEDLKQCNAKWKELHQIETLVQTLRADARSTKAVCYNLEPKKQGRGNRSGTDVRGTVGRTVKPV